MRTGMLYHINLQSCVCERICAFAPHWFCNRWSEIYPIVTYSFGILFSVLFISKIISVNHMHYMYLYHRRSLQYFYLTSIWDRVTHIRVSKLTIIGSGNGLSHDRRQAIIWTIAGLLLIWALGTNFSEILIEILHFHSRKCVWECRLRNGGHFVTISMC